MSQYANAAQEDDEDRYYVLDENEQTQMMTLDELDQAFQDGRISEDSLVCLVGDSKWVKLRELANLDEEEAQAAPSVPPSQITVPAASHYPLPAAQPAPARSYAPSVAPYQISRTPNAPFSKVSLSAPPNSMTPLAFDLDDLDENALRPKRRGGLIAAGIGAVVLAGIAFVGLSGEAEKLVASVPVPTVAAAAALTPAALGLSTPEAPKPATPTPTPAAAAPSPSEEGSPKATRSLTEDMKQALLEKDKQRDTKLKSRAAAAPRSKRSGKKSGPFRAGGSAYDPLNGKL